MNKIYPLTGQKIRNRPHYSNRPANNTKSSNFLVKRRCQNRNPRINIFQVISLERYDVFLDALGIYLHRRYTSVLRLICEEKSHNRYPGILLRIEVLRNRKVPSNDGRSYEELPQRDLEDNPNF